MLENLQIKAEDNGYTLIDMGSDRVIFFQTRKDYMNNEFAKEVLLKVISNKLDQFDAIWY